MKTVLVIEHNPADLIAFAMILQAHGYVALEASSPEEALHACRDYPGRIDVFVAGAALNTEDVRELECFLKVMHPQVQVLLLSDSTKDNGAAGENADSDWVVLARPLDLGTLDRTLRELVGDRQASMADRSL